MSWMSAQKWATPEIHAANPPESWTIIRTLDGSRVVWIIQSEPDDGGTYNYGSRHLTKRAATAALTAGPLVDEYRRRGAYFASDEYAADLSEEAKQEAEARRRIERAGLSVDQMEQWKRLTDVKRSQKKGALQDFLTELLDWFTEYTPISLSYGSLDETEARETYRELSEQWGFASDVETELHRMKYLHIGIERTAVEVLEDLAERERYAA